MSNQQECFEEGRKKEAFGDMGRKAREFCSSPFCQHLRGVQRESLLLMRSVLDMAIDRLEKCERESPVRPMDEDRPSAGPEARRVPVEE